VNKPSPDELLSVSQVAAELQNKITVQTISTWCRVGKLRARRIGFKWFVRRGDLQAFLNTGGEEESRGKAEPLAA
jgi:hypothetical protein